MKLSKKLAYALIPFELERDMKGLTPEIAMTPEELARFALDKNNMYLGSLVAILASIGATLATLPTLFIFIICSAVTAFGVILAFISFRRVFKALSLEKEAPAPAAAKTT